MGTRYGVPHLSLAEAAARAYAPTEPVDREHEPDAGPGPQAGPASPAVGSAAGAPGIATILRLQRNAGNHSVARMLARRDAGDSRHTLERLLEPTPRLTAAPAARLARTMTATQAKVTLEDVDREPGVAEGQGRHW